MAEISERIALRRARRVVLKIGSKTLAADREVYRRLAQELVELRQGGRDFVLVSSGAIALGFSKLGLKERPREMAWLQASAAAGQSVLMQRYEEAFGEVGVPVAQVLLTHADLADRHRDNNARAALGALLSAGALPIINENDTVAVEEIRFGDNDQLASMVVPLVEGDLLVLLSDVEGLLDHEKRRVPLVRNVDREARPLADQSSSGVGTGGMISKIEAARKANLAGASVVIADARVPGILSQVLRGDDVGTLFVPATQRLGARRHWIAFTLRPQGALLLDRGAAEAVLSRGKSLLAVGVLGVRGDFRVGDSVSLLDPEGNELGRGLARLSAADAAAAAGRKREADDDEVLLVHRDDLVVFREQEP
jgi:glutamate 5-kinase